LSQKHNKDICFRKMAHGYKLANFSLLNFGDYKKFGI